MKKFVFIFSALLLVQAAAFAENYVVRPQDSKVEWTATKMTGKHTGKIEIASGLIEFNDGRFTGGEALINTGSLTVEDLQGKGREKLTRHLKSADFFDTEKFPAARIKITNVKPAGENLYDVTADLTIKNITKPVQFQALVKNENDNTEAQAKIVIDRTAYDIRYGSGKFFENLGDKTIHDTFTLEVSVKAGKA